MKRPNRATGLQAAQAALRAELTVLKDAHARATWIREQLSDGDVETALTALDDLAWDLWLEVERQERAS